MCGITGSVWWQSHKAIDASALQRMTDAIAHRGPDADGQFLQPQAADRSMGVALGHRRLSIIVLPITSFV